MNYESRWQEPLARLEAALRPIATRPADIRDPDWQAKLGRLRPLDEAGVRSEAEALLLDILMYYASTTDAERQAIRRLVAAHPSFAWAASPPAGDTPRATLRLRLIHFSLRAEYEDPRDAVLWLEHLCQTTAVEPGELMALRREVAQMSSDEVEKQDAAVSLFRYGFGSTRTMLLRGYGQYGRTSAPEAPAEREKNDDSYQLGYTIKIDRPQ
jgi:hypothetical protein